MWKWSVKGEHKPQESAALDTLRKWGVSWWRLASEGQWSVPRTYVCVDGWMEEGFTLQKPDLPEEGQLDEMLIHPSDIGWRLRRKKEKGKMDGKKIWHGIYRHHPPTVLWNGMFGYAFNTVHRNPVIRRTHRLKRNMRPEKGVFSVSRLNLSIRYIRGLMYISRLHVLRISLCFVGYVENCVCIIL